VGPQRPHQGGHGIGLAGRGKSFEALEGGPGLGKSPLRLVDRKRSRELEAGFHARLSALAAHELVAEVRGGVGLMVGVGLTPELLDAAPNAPGRFLELARAAGVLTRRIPDGLALAPPLTLEPEHVELMVEALGAALDGLADELGAR